MRLTKGAAMLAIVGLLLAAGAPRADAAPQARALLQKYDCYTCHADRETKAAPAFADVAAKYRGDAQAGARIAATVKSGRHGAGPWPMPPMPQVSDADARKIVDYILSVRK